MHPRGRELAAGTAAASDVASTVPRLSVGQDFGRRWPVPTQLQLDEGDAVLVHWATPHAAVRNLSPDVRYMVYFRIHHVAHEPGQPLTLCNLWRHWDGVATAMASL
jgi:ectoine hydroxylase-related dioxygenase (phytanoyl-CoA dioxygenase family)